MKYTGSDYFESSSGQNGIAGVLVSLIALVLISVVALPRLLQPTPPIGPDAFIFEYGGWLFANGGKPYVTFWDVKPPGVYYVTAGLSLLSGGDMAVLHWLSVATNGACVLASSILLVRLVKDLTASTRSGIIAGVAFLAYPTVYALPATGFRPKFAVLVITGGSLYLYNRDRILSATTLAILAPAFWQLSAIVPLTLAALSMRRSWTLTPSIVSRGAGITVIVAAPVIAISGWEPVVAETVFAPFVGREPLTPLNHILRGGFFLGFAAIPAAIGGLELLRRGLHREVPSLVVPFGLFAVVALFIDLDGPPDLLLVYFFTAVGVGLFASRLDRRVHTWVLLGVLAVLGANLLFYASPWSAAYIPPAAGTGPTTHMDVQLFWEQRYPESCHIRLSGVEQKWMETRAGYICN